MMRKLLLPVLLVLCAFIPRGLSESRVLTLAENQQQLITSSTLKWVSARKYSSYIDNAVVGAYQIIKADNVDESGKPDPIKKPVYVCRAKQNGIWVAGELHAYGSKCVISLHGVVYFHGLFEVLINTEDSARLSWFKRDIYTVTDPQGSVVADDDPFRNFVARRKLTEKEDPSQNYILGHLDPNTDFGKFSFVDRNDKNVVHKDGEILVETEPIRYDLKNLIFDNFNRPQPKDERILGHAVLKNEESEDTAKVDTVISYNYTYKLSWGYGHGLLIGLPFDVYEKSKVFKGWWGVNDEKQEVKTVPIEYYLAPGTAVNVTLRGEYIDSDVPYNATLFSYYKDNEVSERILKDSKRESTMINVTPEFGPVYFLHNNSFVPVTTTTTTIKTTMTTTKITTIATEPLPITPLEIEVTMDKSKKKEDDLEMGKKHPNDYIQSDSADAASSILEKVTKADQKSSGFSTVSSSLLISFAVLVMFRVT